MDRRWPACPLHHVRLPRASGDGPHSPASTRKAELAAPRERGWTLVGDAATIAACGCPARAGMDLKCGADKF